MYSKEIGKGPRPVGFPIDFYQKLWHIISRDLLAAAEGSRVSGKILKDINSPFSTHSKVESRNRERFYLGSSKNKTTKGIQARTLHTKQYPEEQMCQENSEGFEFSFKF